MLKYSKKSIKIKPNRKIDQMMMARDTFRGAEEAIYSKLYRIFQAKVSLSDGPLESPIMAP